jgi:uncharacterized protein YuzE
MRITFDPDANAVYIYLKDQIPPGGVSRSEFCDVELSGGPVFLQFDSTGRLIGIEILGARELLPAEVLDEAQRP